MGKVWGLKTTLPQTPHNAGSLRHWVRPFFMESLWKLTYLLEPASLALIATAISVAYASASRALDYGKEMERNLDFSEASITLDRSQALMIPLASSCSLLLMFYLFSSVSHLVTAFTTVVPSYIELTKSPINIS